eukprot:TRINITY_DN3754_c1_g2_i2.p1 TRINITY_DN3754_c1_g2~~TRINITY_DN3754_c1_g2_i2.p1  ORF type:complete len:218 (-),score=36.16 TRINITY_DN3754_c1_g2_i2:328-981(-)
MEKLPISIFNYLGEFLELREIGILSRCSKTFHTNIKKDKIFYHYCIKRYQLNKLPEEFKTWKEFAKENSDLKWEKAVTGISISKDGKIAKSSGWACALTNLSFRSGKHFVLFNFVHYNLGFLGIALKDTKLDGPCFGEKCFAYSSYYRSYRDPICKVSDGSSIHHNKKNNSKKHLWKTGDSVGIYLDLESENKNMTYYINGKKSEDGVAFEKLPEGL